MSAKFLNAKLWLWTLLALHGLLFAAPDVTDTDSLLQSYSPGKQNHRGMSENEKSLAKIQATRIVDRLIRPEYSEFERILILHEYLTESLTYTKMSTGTSAYTALVQNKADCVGFARGYKLLLDTAGITNEVISRTKGHLWNQVSIRGRCYNVDTTWSNTKSGYGQYAWFLLSDAQNASVYHTLDSGEVYPACSNRFTWDESDYAHLDALRVSKKIRIFGTISLPEGTVAPAGGQIVFVNGSRVPILAGENSASFITSVSRAKPEGARLSYTLSGATNGFAKAAFYAGTDQMKLGTHNAHRFDVHQADVKNLALRILPAKYFVSGHISLPTGLRTSAKPIGVTVQLDGYKGGKKVTYYDRVILREGQDELPYQIDIDESDRDRTFKLYYWSPAAEKLGYKKHVFYPEKLIFDKAGLTGYNLALER